MQVKIIKPIWLFCIINLALLAALMHWLYQENQPVNIVVPTDQSRETKMQCVSYAPYYGKEQSPLIEGMWIAPSQIDQDLKLLSTISHCVRTYSVGQGMDYVPEAAAKLGLKVYLGAWIGWTDADNIKEIKLATAKANAYPETVKSLIIGNEVLLRGEQNADAMQTYFTLAKSLSNIPITYADVWEYWVKHQNLAQYIDFQTVHILPYWENNPVAVEDAVQHAEAVMLKMQETFAKPTIIGETGWPSVGRQRNESKPSLVNQARYVRAFLDKANEKQWQYNIIEAIDQPWKRNSEGTVGGYWGLISADLIPKFSLTEPVAERQDQAKLIFLAIVGTLLFLGFSLLLNERRFSALLGLSALGATGSLMAYLQVEYLIVVCRDWIEWLALGGFALLSTLLVLLQPWRISRQNKVALKLMSQLNFIFLVGAVFSSYLMCVDGRYRDFPILLFALPALLLSSDGAARIRIDSSWRALPMLLSLVVVMLAIICIVKELGNHTATIWLVISVLLAVSSWPISNQNKINSLRVSR
jgi:exo-beta-1,3-glucanase (GH17 family)